MAATVAQVLRRFGAQYLATHALNTPQAKAWRAIVACRTAALSGQRLNDLYAAHPRWVIDTLFACTAQSLSEFAGNARWMGATNGMPALSKVFRGKFMAALSAAHRAGALEHDPHAAQPLWSERSRQLYQHDWVVYAKTPLGGTAQVLEYLSRYTHRSAISNERIRSISEDGVVFNVRANTQGGKRKERLSGTEFVRRFLLRPRPSVCLCHKTAHCPSSVLRHDATQALAQ
jgi:hypothetical protein